MWEAVKDALRFRVACGRGLGRSILTRRPTDDQALEGKELGFEDNFFFLEYKRDSAQGRVAEENMGGEFDRCRVEKKKEKGRI